MGSSKGSRIAYTLKGETRTTTANDWHPYTYYYVDTWDLVSQGHRYRDHSGDNGGPFFLEKLNWFMSPVSVNTNLDRGPIVVNSVTGPAGASLPVAKTTAQMNSFGTNAIASVAPTNPQANVLNFVSELYRDGLPKIIGQSITRKNAKLIREAGGEYLNVEFGWKPFVSDIKKLAHSVKNSNELIRQYERGSSKKIRRRFNAPPVTNSRNQKGGLTTYTNAQSYMVSSGGSVNADHQVRSWFSGAFRYHVPVSNNSLNKLGEYEDKANFLLGTRLTPEVVWNAAPWTWAADWFANTGSIMTNISNLGQDGLLMEYGYSMSQADYTFTLSGTNQFGTSNRGYKYSIKQRTSATPWGFGFNLNGLTARQIAIASAIGLTRGGGKPWNAK